MSSSTQTSKRALDVVVSLAGLLLALPVLPLVALAIKIDSHGPVFAREVRVGRQRRRSDAIRGGRRLHDGRGHLFVLLRFRVLGARLRTAGRRPGEHPQLTPVGRLLRRSRLEDLPQLVNVLAGHLSLVGPRPATPALAERLQVACPAWSEAMLGVRPGLLGPAQLQWPESGGTVVHLCERVLFDLHYLTRLRRAGPLGVLRLDASLLLAALGRVVHPAPRRGQEVVRLDYPREFRQADLDALTLARRTPGDVAAEVHERPGGLTAWWYPPRSQGLNLPPLDEACLAGFCDAVRRTPSDGLCLETALRPGPAGAAEDVLRLELPRGLHHVHRVAEHLEPLWDALAERAGDERLPLRLSLALIEALGVVAGRSRPGARVAARLLVGPRGLRVQVEEVAPVVEPSESAFPALGLAGRLASRAARHG